MLGEGADPASETFGGADILGSNRHEGIRVSGKPVTIVMIEDDAGHALLIERNIRRAGVGNELVSFTNGGDALEYILGIDRSGEVSAKKHLLVLLDLNVPDMNGMAVLERLKANPHTKRAPVVVLTTTEDPHEMQRCYDLGANVYVTKPVEYERFANAITRIILCSDAGPRDPLVANVDLPGTRNAVIKFVRDQVLLSAEGGRSRFLEALASCRL